MKNFEAKIKKELVEVMVKKGLEDGIVKLIENDLDCGIIGVGCKIGDFAFYFLPLEDDDLSMDEIYNKYTISKLAEQITDGIFFDVFGEDEKNYYISFLDEHYNIFGNFRIDYFSKQKNAYVYKMVKAKSYKEAIKKSRIKNIEEITLVSCEFF